VTGGAPVLSPLLPDAETLAYAHLTVPLGEESALVNVPEAGGDPVLSEVHLITRLWGMTQTVTQTMRPAYASPLSAGPRPVYPSLEDVLARHPYLRLVADERILTIDPGTWAVDGNLVLPAGYGLRLEAGTELVFGPDRYLLASGPLDFAGEAARPVVLRPQETTWQGIVVLDAGLPSVWRHVVVSDTTAMDQDRWSLTGGITFYRSPIRMSQSRIAGTQAEDGFNVIHASFEFVDSVFADTVSDAFDADFSRGRVERCVFERIGADGIDVSGSEVEVREVILDTLGDKALSVGEASQMTAADLWIRDVRFGVVSKDLSHVTLERARMEGVSRAGLAAYIKKPAYGPASITAAQVEFVDVPMPRRTLIQTDSWVELEGERIWGTDVDVDALYPDE
jgi:hypothetical protein